MEGHLGPDRIQAHLSHGRAHVGAAMPRAGERWLDLGSGGGVPGLILAVDSPHTHVVLLDRAASRCAFLRRAVVELDLGDRVSVLEGDASALARDDAHKGHYDGVVSRAFGPPAAVAEVGAPFLRTGGRLVVSEPPQPAAGRWSIEVLWELGLEIAETVMGPPRFEILVRTESAAVPPRRWSQIKKRPRF